MDCAMRFGLVCEGRTPILQQVILHQLVPALTIGDVGELLLLGRQHVEVIMCIFRQAIVDVTEHALAHTLGCPKMQRCSWPMRLVAAPVHAKPVSVAWTRVPLFVDTRFWFLLV